MALVFGSCGAGAARSPEATPTTVARPSADCDLGPRAASCRESVLAPAAGLSASGGPRPRFACLDGWALLARTRPAPDDSWLLGLRAGHWVLRSSGGSLDNAPELVGIRLGVLDRLNARIGRPIRPEIAAAAIIKRQSHRRGDGTPLSSSAVVNHDGADWLAEPSLGSH